MATVPRKAVEYPTSDGRPMAETDFHRDLMVETIETLKLRHKLEPMTYVTGNILLFYEEGNKRKHISPDVFVAFGVPKKSRLYYLAWEEGKYPDVVMEITSRTTKSEDIKKKWTLYRDVLKVPEYFLFDPFQDYLKPSMQGYRLVNGDYETIELVEGRLPSQVLGLHLEREGPELRLWDPSTGRRLLRLEEKAEAELVAQRVQAEADLAAQRAQAEAELVAQRVQAEADLAAQRAQAEADLVAQRAQAEADLVAQRAQAEAEINRLRRELDVLRRQTGGTNGSVSENGH